MHENLTKQASPDSPVRDYSARADVDDQVHQVRAAPVDLVDPALVRTGCGQAMVEIYNDGRDVDCPKCTEEQASDEQASDGEASDEKVSDEKVSEG